MSNIIIIIPAYNEEKTIEKVVKEAIKFSAHVIVVDDGSTDKTALLASKSGAIVYRHIINRGLGGALGTGLKAAWLSAADIAVTLDADDQHDPHDIPKLIRPIINDTADVVIGSRFLFNQGLPFLRKVYNKAANMATFILFGIRTTDSQSGFRAFNKKALELIEIKTNRMEVSSEIIKEAYSKKLRIAQIPIKARYTKYSLSKGQNFLNGLSTFFKLIILKFSK